MPGRRSVLLLCRDDRRHASNVREHIRALSRGSRHDVHVFNPFRQSQPTRIDLDRFDAVVIHYTIVTILEMYLPSWLADEIAAYDGLKIQLIQDEYRWIDAITERMRELGIDVIFTLVPEAEVPKVYGDRVPSVTTIRTLAGFVPDDLLEREVQPLAERPIDVGYRGRTVPFWLGRLAQEKLEIGRGFLARAAAYDLRCDIAWGENDRLYGEAWTRFLSSSVATLGTESGASIADYDGSIERRVKEYLAEHTAATFEEVEREVLQPFEGNIRINVISPRQFEAAALKTALVLFPGDYSGRLEPGRHYIELQKDFSNFGEVVEQLGDRPALQELVDCTYEEVARDPRNSLESFVAELDEVIAARTPEPSNERGRARAPRRSVRTRVGQPVADQFFRAAKTGVAISVIARRPRLRSLAWAYATDSGARERVSAAAVLDDLLKLALVEDAAAGRAAFRVVPSFDTERRRLTLGSKASATSTGDDGVPIGEVADALRGGELEVVWNHAAVGETVRVPVVANKGLLIGVGYHGVEGAHSFRALRRLGTLMPERVLRALEPLLR
jgi:hypothetical protein